MADYRSKSSSDGKMQIDAPSSSTSKSSQQQQQVAPPQKLKKGRNTKGSTSKLWSFNDPKVQRKKRIAGYNVYTIEGKLKGSVKKSVKWLKDSYTRMFYEWR